MAKKSSNVTTQEAKPERMVSGHKQAHERTRNPALRPRGLDELIGQDALRTKMSILVEAARLRQDPLDHVLLYGPPGLGKTTLSHILAYEMGAELKITSGPAIERQGDLAAILTNLKRADVLFIDEIHRLRPVIEEILYPAMEDFQLDLVIGAGPAARTVRLPLPQFTVIGATTRLALITEPLRARFGIVDRFHFYDQRALQQIVQRAGRELNIDIERAAAQEIARRARGTPRVALRMLRRLRDFAQVRAAGKIDMEVAHQGLSLLDIDFLGLDDMDRRLIDCIVHKFGGGPVGLETLAASISEDTDTVMDVVEPYLLQLGFLKRTPSGRVATELAYKHMGVLPPRRTPTDQSPLFDTPAD